MRARKVSNPLALAVMGYLWRRPMHPYETASLMRDHHKHESIRLNYGALYKVVAALEREGFIVPVTTVKDGRRPERTVYALTAAGRNEYLDWLRELIGQPAKEYTQFAAGLSFIGALPPATAVALLHARAQLLDEEISEKKAVLDSLIEGGLPEFLLVEGDHEIALRKAELAWVRRLAGRIADRSLGGMDQWDAFHRTPDPATSPDTEASERG